MLLPIKVGDESKHHNTIQYHSLEDEHPFVNFFMVFTRVYTRGLTHTHFQLGGFTYGCN